MMGRGLEIVSESGSAKESCCQTDGVNIVEAADSAGAIAERGFSGNVLMVTLGCAKNLVDSEVMLGVLKGQGFRPIDDPEQADLIVVNTCAFLQSAVEEGIERILELSNYRRGGRCRKLIVAGCMVERYRADLEKSLPEVDRFISTDELLKVGEDEATSEQALDTARRPYFLYDESMPRIRSTTGHTAYVKIAEGCDRPCAFCIIPKIRGSFRSRPISSIISESTNLLADGVRELSLVAQDLTAYGSDWNQSRTAKPMLDQLLRELTVLGNNQHELEQNSFWVRLLYAYPIGVNEQLLRTIVDSPVICNYLDLPLQHISNPVLKRMNRPLGERGTRGLIEQIRSVAPEIALRTTFVVGFPGETEEDVDSLVEFVQCGHFTHLGAFTYSQEPEAKAYTFSDQVPEELKAERRARVMEAQRAVVESRLKSFIGRTERVLIDGLHTESDLLLVGRTEWQAPETDSEVIINEIDEAVMHQLHDDFAAETLKGKFGRVLFTESADYDLVGRLVAIES